MLILDERHRRNYQPSDSGGSRVAPSRSIRVFVSGAPSRRSHRSEACLSPGGAPVVPQRVSLRTDR
jgi:hypothetical protein